MNDFLGSTEGKWLRRTILQSRNLGSQIQVLYNSCFPRFMELNSHLLYSSPLLTDFAFFYFLKPDIRQVSEWKVFTKWTVCITIRRMNIDYLLKHFIWGMGHLTVNFLMSTSCNFHLNPLDLVREKSWCRILSVHCGPWICPVFKKTYRRISLKQESIPLKKNVCALHDTLGDWILLFHWPWATLKLCTLNI